MANSSETLRIADAESLEDLQEIIKHRLKRAVLTRKPDIVITNWARQFIYVEIDIVSDHAKVDKVKKVLERLDGGQPISEREIWGDVSDSGTPSLGSPSKEGFR